MSKWLALHPIVTPIFAIAHVPPAIRGQPRIALDELTAKWVLLCTKNKRTGMHLEHGGNAILSIVLPQQFALTYIQLKFPPEIKAFTGGAFLVPPFFVNFDAMINIDMRYTHGGNSALYDESSGQV